MNAEKHKCSKAAESIWAILDGHEVKPVDVMTGAHWIEKVDRSVARTKIGSVIVSTVFLGINHAFGYGPPQWFETMIFGAVGELDQACWRYATWDEAVAGHQEAVKLVKSKHGKANG